MKKQNQAAKRNSRNTAVSQHQNTPTPVRTSPDDQPPDTRAGRPPAEFKIMRLRDCAARTVFGETPQSIAKFWRQSVQTSRTFTTERECFAVILLDVRRKVIGFEIIGLGTLDSVLVHPREVFRLAIMHNAAAVIIAHNHPSGNPSPSDSDIAETRKLLRAGEIVKIELLDHVIIGRATKERPKPYCSLRELGYFYESGSNAGEKPKGCAHSELGTAVQEARALMALMEHKLVETGELETEENQLHTDVRCGFVGIHANISRRLGEIAHKVHAEWVAALTPIPPRQSLPV